MRHDGAEEMSRHAASFLGGELGVRKRVRDALEQMRAESGVREGRRGGGGLMRRCVSQLILLAPVLPD